MNIRVISRVGKRRLALSMAVAAAIAGVVWFSAAQGIGIASADGGGNDATPGGLVQQEYNQQHNVASRLFIFDCRDW